jgi:hypothetical protein
MELTQKQIDIIKHTVGLNNTPKQPKGFYRNRFSASITHTEYPILKSLVDLKLMEHSAPQEMFGGDMMFSLTIEGLKLAKTYSL